MSISAGEALYNSIQGVYEWMPWEKWKNIPEKDKTNLEIIALETVTAYTSQGYASLLTTLQEMRKIRMARDVRKR